MKNVEQALEQYHREGCQALIAIGGGSSMDCAKAVGARIARPRTPLGKLKGTLRVWRRLPTLIAIPTTAGTGSETTLAAVITDADKKHKYVLNDFVLIPRYAVLDASLTRSLPPHLTATTGMDALTHAVEAYIGRSTTRETREKALEANPLYPVPRLMTREELASFYWQVSAVREPETVKITQKRSNTYAC